MTTAVTIAPTPILQFFNNQGQPCVGGSVLTQVGGVNAVTYQDSAGTVALPNPIPLNSRGEISNSTGISCQLFLTTGVVYTFTLFDANGNQLNQALYVAPSNVLGTLALITGANLIGFEQSGTGMAPSTVAAKLQQSLSLADLAGADPTGATASDAALAAALATGRAIDLGGPENNWLFNSTTSYTGKVVLTGRGATVTTNQLFLQVTNGTGSRLSGFKVLPLTVPYTLLRVPGTWTATTGQVVQSLNGYMPGAQDTDIWSSLSAAIQTQGNTIHPAIYFTVDSVNGASDVEISNISGSCLAIIVEGYSDVRIHDNNFSSNNYTYGAVVLLNGVPVNYKSTPFGFTLPRGVGNKVYNNQIRYGTLCSIVYFGQDKYLIEGNETFFNGETGIKSYQYDGVAGPSATTGCISTNGRVVGNHSYGNYYDGIDLQVFYGVAFAYYFCGTVVEGNISEQNRMTGYTSNGASMTFGCNMANMNGTHGISVVGSNNTVVGNHARNNCLSGTTIIAQVFDIIVQGDDCVSAWNNISNASAPSTFNYLHSGVAGANPTSSHEGDDFGNYCDQGAGRITISPTIPSSKQGIQLVPFVQISGYLATSVVVNVNTTTYTVGVTDSALSFNTGATCTVTLPSASSFPGRKISMRNTAAFAINSASSNVGPLTGGTTASIMPATVGKWVEMQSDGGIWVVMGAN